MLSLRAVRFLIARSKEFGTKAGEGLYVQGQSPSPKIREYFYYIDHQGQLFMDDARMKNFTSCFKDPAFLKFFFQRLRLNETERYRETFPFLSLCGRERNFIRCDDLPIVYTAFFEDSPNGNEMLIMNNIQGALSQPFEPRKLFVDHSNGRLYHPAPEKYGGVGLIKSAIADELSLDFSFSDPKSPNIPTHLRRNNTSYELDHAMLENLRTLRDTLGTSV